MSDVQAAEKHQLVIRRGPDRTSQFGPRQKVYIIDCGWCQFDYERQNTADARYFAQRHNESVHSSGMEIVDLTKAPNP